MNDFKCDKCGSRQFTDKGQFLECKYCDSTFAKEVPTKIAFNDDISRLFAMIKNNPADAKLYANLILDLDPFNREALHYLGE